MSNREELTRQAEKSLRQGRVEDAIALYQELADLTPVDWGIVKQLADLFERAGQREAASRQFCRWADHLAVEGFHSKAAALYKKVLKLEPSHEHALWQLGEVSLELKLRADARLAFQRVVELRQRRSDAAGAESARQRLATLEAAAPTPSRMPLSGGPAMVPTSETPLAPVADHIHEAAPAPSPTPAPVPPGAIVAAVAESPVALPEPPPEAPERRLARLRHEAEEAERLHPGEAEARWQAVLDADPQDVATRMRLVQRAMDRRDLDTADRLALPLDASETGALVLLVELAWRRGHPDALRRLVAARVHAGASPGHILAPFDTLASRLPDAAREALMAAVAAWKSAGQPGHAVAALELADRRGLLDTDAYLHWVEICVDAGVAGLSNAQAALARAYVKEGRVAEARAVAEDVFVRESGAEPYRALLLEVLDRLGDANPHRVLVDLLTPPSEVADEPPPAPLVVPDEIVELDLDLTLPDPDDGLAEPHGPLSPPAVVATAVDRVAADLVPESPPVPAPGTIGFGTPEAVAAPAFVAPRSPEPGLAVDAPAAATHASTPAPSFDWAFLLGRDVDEAWPAAAPAVAIAEHADAMGTAVLEPSASTECIDPLDVLTAEMPADELIDVLDAGLGATVSAEPAAVEDQGDAPQEGYAEVLVSVPEPGGDSEPTPTPLAVSSRAEEPDPVELAPIAAGSLPASLGAPEHDPYEVRTPVDPVLAKIAAAQPQMAPPSEALPPTFSVPTSWFDGTPAESGNSPRQRHPEDAYLFQDDDQVPSRWGPRRAMAPLRQEVSAPASQTPIESPVAADVPPVALDESSDAEPFPLAVASEPESDHGAEPTPQELVEPVPDLVEEEVDLTQLLEELRLFDTVLPDPPARPVLPGSPDEASKMLAVLEPPPSDDLAASAPPLSERLTPPPTIDDTGPAYPASTFAQDTTTELDAVFADLQRHTDDRLVAEQQLAAGRVFLAAGLISEAARAFERASQAPRSRFAAAQALAELHRSRGQLADAVSWYEQAAAAPVPDADVKRPVLYDLAESLEALGETDRALGVLLDLLSQVEDYRDARARLDRLLRVDAGG